MSTTDETYNGWTNRETWAVALHINNDQGWQESVLQAMRDYVQDSAADEAPVEAYLAGEIIRENVEEVLAVASWGDTSGGVLVRPEWLAMRDDIGSLWRVNWDELGAAFLADLAELDES